MLTQDYAELLFQHQKPAHLADGLINLRRAGILQDYAGLLFQHHKPHDLAYGLTHLHRSGICTQENIKAICETAQVSSEIFARCIVKLSDIEQNNNHTREIVLFTLEHASRHSDQEVMRFVDQGITADVLDSISKEFYQQQFATHQVLQHYEGYHDAASLVWDFRSSTSLHDQTTCEQGNDIFHAQGVGDYIDESDLVA
ncbi:hypothetical protein [Facilibium subflavum]|uniref:hypothetical protein n=1 Tax=Facilibium subflavum TaxID=2219058 RepID=UPI000E64A351|nr:hypothetical protein [Facilibium subflavum]